MGLFGPNGATLLSPTTPNTTALVPPAGPDSSLVFNLVPETDILVFTSEPNRAKLVCKSKDQTGPRWLQPGFRCGRRTRGMNWLLEALRP